MEELTQEEQDALRLEARNYARLMEKTKEELVELLILSNKKALIGMQTINEITEIVGKDSGEGPSPRKRLEQIQVILMDKSVELVFLG